MNENKILRIMDNPELKRESAKWFHEKWGIPTKTYEKSMEMSMESEGAIPQWYVVKNGNYIVGGAGVIENDFHDRKDLTPNICSVYVEKLWRGQGIAGNLLNFICKDMRLKGMDTLYLITDLHSFYEKYDWKYLCNVQEEGETTTTKMYMHSYEN